MLKTVLVLFIVVFTLPSCTTTSPVMASTDDTFVVTTSGASGYIPLGVLRKEAYEMVNSFASSKGMVAEIVSVREVPAGFAIWPQVDIRFRLKNSENMANVPNVVENTNGIKLVSTDTGLDSMKITSVSNVENNINQEISSLSRELGDIFSDKKEKVVVLPFRKPTRNNEEIDLFGDYLSDKIATVLKQINPDLELLERNLSSQIAYEKSFNNLGLIDEEKLKNLDVALPGRYLISGSYILIGNNIDLLLRVVDIRGSKVIYSKNIIFFLEESYKRYLE